MHSGEYTELVSAGLLATVMQIHTSQERFNKSAPLIYFLQHSDEKSGIVLVLPNKTKSLMDLHKISRYKKLYLMSVYM